MAKLIETEAAGRPRPTFLATADAAVKVDDIYPGLLQWCKPAAGEGIYGIPVDCNPKVFWFNKDMLSAAGCHQNPAAAVRGRTWNQAALTTC